jgi:acid phosphatase family membrane protein YuiD
MLSNAVHYLCPSVHPSLLYGLRSTVKLHHGVDYDTIRYSHVIIVIIFDCTSIPG